MDLLRSFEKRSRKWTVDLLDPKTAELDEAKLSELTQLDKSRILMADRLAELAEFYNLSEEEASQVASVQDKDALEDVFQNVTNDEGLFKDYQDAALLYTARLQLAYTRFPQAVKLVKHINSVYLPWQRNNVKVLDYGCGVADYALAFATQGYKISICDIKGGNLDFAEWRFKKRGIAINTLAATQADPFPQLKSYDVVLSGELLEHVRDPLQVVKNIHGALPSGGLFWYSGYPTDPREVGGDHLVEAAEQRDDVLAFMAANFETATRLHLPGYLFKKK